MAILAKWLIALPLAVLAVLGAGVVIMMLALRSDAVTSYLAERLSTALGRQLDIGGLSLAPGLPPRIRATDVNLANADWAEQRQMAQAAELVVGIDLRALVQGELVVRKLHVIRPWLLLERSEEGEPNWTFLTRGTGPIPAIHTFSIEGAEMVLRNVAGLPETQLSAASARGSIAEPAMGFRLEARGQLEQSAYTLSVQPVADGSSFRARFETERLDLRPLVESAPDVDSESLLPDVDLRLGPLREREGAIELEVGRLVLPGFDLEDLAGEVHVELDAVRFEPLRFRLADGEVRAARLHLAATADAFEASAEIFAEGLSLGRMLERVGVEDAAGGDVLVHVALIGRGRSLADLVGTADGELTLILQDGRVDEDLARLATQDLLEVLGAMRSDDDDTVPLNCVIADFQIANGVMKARTLILDTEEVKIVGNGTLDLAQETVDLQFLPRNKDFSLISGQAPVHVSGGFGDVSIEVDAGAVAASLVTPLELGMAEDADCRRLAQAALEGSPDWLGQAAWP